MKSGRNRGLAGGQHPRQVKNPSNHQKSSNSSTSRGSSRRSSSIAGQSAAAGGSRRPKTSDPGADNSDNGDHSKNPRLLKFLSEVFVATSIYLSKKVPRLRMLQVDVEKTCVFFLFLQDLQKIHLDKWMVLQCAFSQRCCIPTKWFDNYALVFFGPRNRFKAKILFLSNCL